MPLVSLILQGCIRLSSMSSSVPITSYTALQEKDEIRLLHLYPGTETAPIVCTLHHVELSKDPSYEALSYQWGPESPLKIVQIDGQPRHVRSNLYFALQRLRRRRKARILWVDALCINQEDDTERSHQVFQMGNIYSHATQVCVWLGLADSFAYGAARLLKRKETRKGIKLGIIGYPEEWYDLAEFCKREYWDRLWIIQEVVLAPKIEVYCGHLHFPWEALSDILCSLDETVGIMMDEESERSMPCDLLGFYTSIVSSTTAALCRERKQRKQTTALDDLSLLALLRRYRNAKCTDVRDKIFGLHSFAPRCCTVANPVDFKSSAWELCNRLLYHHCSCHESFSDVASLLDRSKELHCPLMSGSLKQKGTGFEFPIYVQGIDGTIFPVPKHITGYRYSETISVSGTTSIPYNYNTGERNSIPPLKIATELEISIYPQPEILESFTTKGKLHESSTLEDLGAILLATVQNPGIPFREEHEQLPTTRYESLVQIFYHNLIEDVHRLATESEIEYGKKLAEQRHVDFRYKAARLRWPDMNRDARKDVLRRLVDCLFKGMRRRGFRDDETRWCLGQALNLKMGDQGD